jgi:hypothetical protein
MSQYTIDDGHQGPMGEKLTDEEQAEADKIFKIARLQDQAQDAEDREQLGRASQLRAEARAIQATLRTPH